MSIGVTAGLVIGGLGAAGGIGSALIGSHAASSAAKTQEQGVQAGIDAETAANQAALAEQKREFDTTQGNLAPWMQAGQGALSLLSQGTQPGGSLVTPFGETYQTPAAFSYAAFDPGAKFTAPTLDNTNDPGYAFRLQQGEQALQRGASAGGGAFSGGTLAALTRYGQDYASNEYQNVYNRALQGYQTNFNNSLNAYNTNLTGALNTYDTNVNTGLNAYNTRFNAYNTGQTNAYNRLAGIAGLGQNATNTAATTGSAYANAQANLLQNQGVNTANLLTQGANAAAAGTLGTASAINSGINSASSNLMSGYLINALTGGSGGGGAQPGYNPWGPAQYVP